MDLALLSARIFTGDPRHPWAEALAVRDNQIIAVGRNEEIRQACRRDTHLLELPGRLVTPGLVDAHMHFMSLGWASQMVNLQNLTSLEACREKIRQAAAGCPPGQWIIGRGWDHHKWQDKREPTFKDLDDLTPDHPAMMIRACGHSIWVNSRALALAHIDRRTPEPEGGKIERFPASGDPTGLIREARWLVEDHIPAPSPDERQEAGLRAQAAALRVGVTGVHSCEGLQEWEALSALDRQGKLKLRVYHLLPTDKLEEATQRGIRPGFGSRHLWFGHVKLFADGSLGSGTALLHEPYADDASQRGIPFLAPEVLQERIEAAYRQGWDVAIHAIGDKAVTHALEKIAAARARYPGPRRDRIEHVQLFRPQDLSLFRDLGAVASVQPVFVPTDWATADVRWGQPRCGCAYAWKTLLEARIPLQFGSDAPVESINPLYGLHAAVTRQDRQGNPAGGWCPNQKLTLPDALAGYTRRAAWTARREDHLGSVAKRKWADLTVFAQDLTRLAPEDWLQTEVEMTMVDGKIVYQRS
ncbi:MAG: amidohydrolase [Desulfobacterales bacterium]|nr:MAG: amidohydrolase [Desulfobacterales bacterium]